MENQTDPNPVAVLAKPRPARPKPEQKIITGASKAGGPLNSRQKRVFGTALNKNIVSKPAVEEKKKLVTKPVPRTGPAPETPTSAVVGGEKLSLEKDGTLQRKKKGVCFEEKSSTVSGKEDARTPVPSFPLAKPRRSGTPYHTAENCSKCKFDRMETASYWLSQIKLAESTGKHFVTGAFFKLANECKAEPFRNLWMELRRYMARHSILSSEAPWGDVSLIYGLTKEDPAVGSGDDGIESTTDAATAAATADCQV